MIEPEVAFADLAANADLAEQSLSSVIRRFRTAALTIWRSSMNVARDS